MFQSFRSTVLLSLVLGCFAIQDAISGRYLSESGAEMRLFCDVSTSTAPIQSANLTGWFSPKSGNVSNQYHLSGQATSCGRSAYLSFSVAWSDQRAATSWVAQAVPNGSGNSVYLYSVWLMISEDTVHSRHGYSNNIGTDWFFFY